MNTSVNISPLQLNDFSIGKLTLVPGTAPITEPHQIAVVTAPAFSRNNEDHRQWLVRLNVTFKSAPNRVAAYEGHVEGIGQFMITDPAVSEENQSLLIAVNATGIVYSSIRQVIASLTAQSTNGKMILPAVSFTGLRISTSPQRSDHARSTKPDQDLPLEIVKNNLTAWNRHDIEAIAKTWDEGITFFNPVGEMKKAQAIGLQRQFWKAFPNASMEIESIGFAKENLVVTEFTIRGTHTGPLPDGTAATGRPFVSRGASFTQFEGGKIVSEHVYQNPLSIIEQLGLKPKQALRL